MRDFLLIKELQLSGFARVFAIGLAEVAPLIAVEAAALDELHETIEEFDNDLAEIGQTRNRLKSLTRKKNQTQRKLKNSMRGFTKKARANPNVTDAHIKGMGLKPRDTIKTRVGAPQSSPYIVVEINRGRQHVVKIFDFSDSTARAKPKGVTGAEVWFYIGDSTAINEKTMRYAGTATNGKMIITHDAEEAGKEAHYLARWVNRRGERGGWSNTSNATVAS